MPFKEFLEYTLITISDEKQIQVMDIMVVAAIIVGTMFAFRWFKRLLTLALKREKINVGQQYAIFQLVKYLTIVIVTIIVLEVLHVQPTVLLAGSTALLVGIGLGLQGLANDIVCGFILLMEPSIRVDDIIEVNGTVAIVKDIGIRTSQIETREGVFMIIPNHLLVSEKVINWTTNKSISRFSVTVGVAYGSDVSLVKDILIKCAEKHNEIRKSPKPNCRFTDFSNSSLDFELLFWSKSMFNIEDIQSDLRFMINSEFNKNNVVIPFPQRDIHIKTTGIGLKSADDIGQSDS